uniref:primosomal protein DnaI n=1 Tax=Aneurinibacillus aneurinilyticus TaxID=1391 RepID=UPI0023F0913F
AKYIFIHRGGCQAMVVWDRFIRIQNQVESHELIQELRQQYPRPEPPQTDAFRLADLEQYVKENEACKSCSGLQACPNLMQGHVMTLRNDKPAFNFEQCEVKKGEVRQKEIARLIDSHYVPEHILYSTFASLANEEERMPAVMAAMQFCATFKKGDSKQGLYLHGSMGRGKSAIAGAMTQELAKRGADVVMVYVPDFMREIKDSIQDNSIAKKLEVMMNVSVLILDDIGAESLTAWTRDEILGPILQRRMEKLPTVYTSNLTPEELEAHLANVPKEEKALSKVKAKRIMERIAPFVKTMEVRGRNWRREAN